jgi:hypothetical protein
MKAQFKNDFDNWVTDLSPCWARSGLFAKFEFRPVSNVKSTELVDTFLELHPGHNSEREDLLQYAREGRPNGVYVVNLQSWDRVHKHARVE